MALPTKAILKASCLVFLKSGVPGGNPTTEQLSLLDAQADSLADLFLNTIKAATVTVPGAGLSGYSGAVITGTSTTGGLT